MRVCVDTREKEYIYNFLVKLFPQHEFVREAMKEGDYESEKVIVERKRMADLYGSVMGNGKEPGRLNDQLNRLCCHDDKIVVVMVIGSVNKFVGDMKSEINMNINPEILYGAISSICSRNRIHVMWIEEEWNALRCMVKFMEQVDDGKWMVPSKREPDNLFARLVGITPVQGKEMMRKFKSISAVASAPMSSLQEIDGIGPMKAKKIHTVLNSGW